MTERCTLDGFVITPIEPQGSLFAGTDHGRLFINEPDFGISGRVLPAHKDRRMVAVSRNAA